MSTVHTQPVVLARYRPDIPGEAGATVHVVAHPGPVTAGALSALCGALLTLDQIETVTPGEGMSCTLCSLLRSTTAPTMASAVPGWGAAGHRGGNPPVAAATGYRALCGWPVSVRGDQVWLRLARDAVALIIPTTLATAARAILTARGCPAPVMAHPYAPGHQVLLAGEPYGVALPWPPQVQTAIATLPLPPTVTPRGPLTWVQLPETDTVRLCREIDIFAAVRTALRAPPPTGSRSTAAWTTCCGT